MSYTGIVFQNDYLDHNTGSYHPENSQRLVSIINHLTNTGLLEKLKLIPPYYADAEWIGIIHEKDYIESIKKACENGYTNLDTDTTICSKAQEIALLAAGGGLAAADAVMTGLVNNCFCAV